jgi:type IV secretory pathway VirD2 relaxase
MEKDLGTDLEWVAVEHHNTEHPHAHVVVRGVRNDGAGLRMSRKYIQRGIRSAAEHLCTRQFGFRTELDAADAERRDCEQVLRSTQRSKDRQKTLAAHGVLLSDDRRQ